MAMTFKDGRILALDWKCHEDWSSDLCLQQPSLNQPLKYYWGWQDAAWTKDITASQKTFGTVDKALTFIPAVTLIKSLFLLFWISALTFWPDQLTPLSKQEIEGVLTK